MSVQSHFIIWTDSEGNAQRTPMKTWLRGNPDVLPGVNPTTTQSYHLRALLRRAGWRQEETGGQYLLFEPSITEQDSLDFIQASQADFVEDAGDQEEELAFALEHQLRDFLIANLPSIPVDGKKLRLFKDQNGRNGREYPTEVGFIDILAEDDAGNLYVFELKRGRTSDHVVGQILRYMGWCANRLVNGRQVRGVIVAQDHDDRTKYAATVVPGLMILEYAIEFRLRPSLLGVERA